MSTKFYGFLCHWTLSLGGGGGGDGDDDGGDGGDVGGEINDDDVVNQLEFLGELKTPGCSVLACSVTKDIVSFSKKKTPQSDEICYLLEIVGHNNALTR